MPENENKRTRRTPEERAAAIDEKIQKLNETISAEEEKKQAAAIAFDAKIASLKEKIASLEKQKKDLLFPKPVRKTKKQKITEIISKAQKGGLTPEEIATRLGVEMQ